LKHPNPKNLKRPSRQDKQRLWRSRKNIKTTNIKSPPKMKAKLIRILIASTALAAFSQPLVAATIAELSFDTLPSAQGWGFFSSGPHSSTEGDSYAVDGTSLNQNTIASGGNGIGSTGYIFTPSPAPTGDYSVFWDASVASQTIYQQPELRWASFSVQVDLGGDAINFGVTPTELYINGSYFTPLGFDATEENSYRVEVSSASNSFSLYVNGDLEQTGSTIATSLNAIELGDNTGRADSIGSTSLFRIETGIIPEPSSAFLLGLFSLFAAFSRRRDRS
jgi:hypothetical protein